LRLQPHSADAHLNLGIALVDQYDRVAAFDESQQPRGLILIPPGAHYNLGHFYFETGKYDEARKSWEQPCACSLTLRVHSISWRLRKGRTIRVDRATELLHKVVVLQPQNADAQYLLADIWNVPEKQPMP